MTKEELQEMVELFGKDRIPNPDQYPLCFAFTVKSFEHYKRMSQKGSSNA